MRIQCLHSEGVLLRGDWRGYFLPNLYVPPGHTVYRKILGPLSSFGVKSNNPRANIKILEEFKVCLLHVLKVFTFFVR
jgi:hypothetical protein